MGSDQNGITQSPFTDAWTTPDVGGTGLNGTGDGFESDAGPNGIQQSPFDKAVVPIPGLNATPGGEIPTPPDFVQIDGGQPQSQQPWDVTSSRNTVDKK